MSRTAKELKNVMDRLTRLANRLEGLGFHDQAMQLDKAYEGIETVREGVSRL